METERAEHLIQYTSLEGIFKKSSQEKGRACKGEKGADEGFTGFPTRTGIWIVGSFLFKRAIGMVSGPAMFMILSSILGLLTM